MKMIHPLELGATLFVPATHKDIEKILGGEKYPHLKSVVLDTEDALLPSQTSQAVARIEAVLAGLQQKSPFIFLRPRNPEVLQKFLACKDIQKIDGFVLPKFSLANGAEYLEMLKETPFCFMPSIEGEELFAHAKLEALKEMLLPYKERIPSVRFGLEDLLKMLGMRRGCDESVFDRSAPAAVLGHFIALFKSAGFNVSGGVFPCFRDDAAFVRDVERDLREGLFSKTIIHPRQIALAHECYKVTPSDFEEALQLCQSSEAVFALGGKMAENVTMQAWAQTIVMRAEIYGVS
jgi:citrate lyase beta subunit